MTAPLEPSVTRMLGAPFGADERGVPIDHGNGRTIAGAIEWMRVCAGQKALEDAPPGLAKADLDERVHQAQETAVDRLVTMLNEAMPHARYRVTREYLSNERNRYSYEFRLFVAEFCRAISGDADFFRHAGARSAGGPIALLGRPLGVQRTFALLPALTAKLVKTDLRVPHVDSTSAVVQWYGEGQVSLVPEAHRQAYIRYACQTYQGAYGSIPRVVFGIPVERVREVRCQADGAECCEWEIQWVSTRVHGGWQLVAAGAVATLALAAAVIAGLPVTFGLALLGAAAPLGVAWQWRDRKASLNARDALQQQLMEERDLAERELDESERANANLQMANLQLTRQLSEITTLHESALTLSTTLEIDEVIDHFLDAVVRHLGYDRAMALIADDEARVLSRGRAIGDSQGTSAPITDVQLSFDQTDSKLVQAFHADGPLVFERVDQDPHEINRALALALGASSFIACPLISKGHRAGILAVDNANSGRPLDLGDTALLMTLGRQVAGALETARLYTEIEEHNRTLEERVAARTAELAQTTAELERELAERRRLRERELEYLVQVNRVVQAAAAVEADTFDPRSLDETSSRDDELGQLARTFGRMAGTMIEREHRLKQEVADLRIEIDSGHQAQKVAEIVGSEYFRELRSQARDLRRIVGTRGGSTRLS